MQSPQLPLKRSLHLLRNLSHRLPRRNWHPRQTRHPSRTLWQLPSRPQRSNPPRAMVSSPSSRAQSVACSWRLPSGQPCLRSSRRSHRQQPSRVKTPHQHRRPRPLRPRKSSLPFLQSWSPRLSPLPLSSPLRPCPSLPNRRWPSRSLPLRPRPLWHRRPSLLLHLPQTPRPNPSQHRSLRRRWPPLSQLPHRHPLPTKMRPQHLCPRLSPRLPLLPRRQPPVRTRWWDLPLRQRQPLRPSLPLRLRS